MVDVAVSTRYYQFDQQGVAFNMWYLAFLEDARNGYLDAVGYRLEDLLADGCDIQLVHVSVDWRASCRYGDPLMVASEITKLGRSSVTFSFVLSVGGTEVASATSVYVIVGRSIGGKADIPERLRAAVIRANASSSPLSEHLANHQGAP